MSKVEFQAGHFVAVNGNNDTWNELAGGQVVRVQLGEVECRTGHVSAVGHNSLLIAIMAGNIAASAHGSVRTLHTALEHL